MKTNRIYKILLMAAFLFCLISCKKTSSNAVPITETGIKYELSNTIFPNPERGFIRTLIVYSGGPALNLAQLSLLRSQNISLVLRFFYLDAFKNQVINAAELALIQSDLDKIRQAGIKVILRFAYTDDMAGTDAPYSIIAQHIDQLKPIFETNKDVIAFVQAGFIGAYGEWHSSSNGLNTTENERLVLLKLLSALPPEIMVQVRTPGMKQQIFNTSLPLSADLAYSAENRSRVGHHNDCFLTGGTDYGTYTNITLDKLYISNEALYVPTGGETCPPSAGYNPSCNEGRNEMKFLKWTYLNLDWYPATINAWRNSGCFDEFQTNLGYRLALVDSKFAKDATHNSNLLLDVNIINKGYAPLYNKKITYLLFKNKISGVFYEKELAVDLRNCKPAATLAINETVSLSGIPVGVYDLYLRIADKAPNLKSRIEYAVRLANTDVWVDENGGMNNLKQQLKIN